MDVGVGSFVFSQGVVSAIPLLKNSSHLSAPLLPKLTMVAWKMLPLIGLGLLRVLIVKGAEYPVSMPCHRAQIPQLNDIQEHVSEYGIHWNFFITLAALPPLQVLLHPLLLHSPMLGVGLGITLRKTSDHIVSLLNAHHHYQVHQSILSKTSLQTWAIYAPRTNIMTQNKEGLVSLPGITIIPLLTRNLTVLSLQGISPFTF